jgi:hypothetical protein
MTQLTEDYIDAAPAEELFELAIRVLQFYASDMGAKLGLMREDFHRVNRDDTRIYKRLGFDFYEGDDGFTILSKFDGKDYSKAKEQLLRGDESLPKELR